MVFVRPEALLRETKTHAAGAWFRPSFAVTRKRFGFRPLPFPRSVRPCIPERGPFSFHVSPPLFPGETVILPAFFAFSLAFARR